jgi:Domain of unknown function (DUF4419)
MAACKSFFEYGMRTCCGFPYVILEGTEDDWLTLRDNSAQLIMTRCENKFAKYWCHALIPVLDKILEEYRHGKNGDQPDSAFWNSFIKMGTTRMSGGKPWFNGWINIFFPFIM